MRINSIITAMFVTLAAYLFIMERDWLLAVAGNPPAETEETVEVSTETKPVTVQVARLQVQDIQSGILLRGRTEAFRLVSVKSETSGRVISQPLRKGLLVEEGELLCELDPGTTKASLAEAKARLKAAEKNSENSKALVKRGVASKTSGIAQDAELEAAHASLIRAEESLKQLLILAPFDGLLESDTAELGELLQPGAPCATIVSLDPIKLVGFATEEQIIKLSVGALAGARLVDGREIVGQVTFLSRSADQQTRTYRVEITAPNEKLEFRDGATAEILIGLDGERGHLVPQSALTLNDAGLLGLRTVENDKAKFIPVRIVRDTANGTWVAGLPDLVDVIVVGQEFVIDGRDVIAVLQDDAS